MREMVIKRAIVSPEALCYLGHDAEHRSVWKMASAVAREKNCLSLAAPEIRLVCYRVAAVLGNNVPTVPLLQGALCLDPGPALGSGESPQYGRATLARAKDDWVISQLHILGGTRAMDVKRSRLASYRQRDAMSQCRRSSGCFEMNQSTQCSREMRSTMQESADIVQVLSRRALLDAVDGASRGISAFPKIFPPSWSWPTSAVR
jgi:hypothetical protein